MMPARILVSSTLFLHKFVCTFLAPRHISVMSAMICIRHLSIINKIPWEWSLSVMSAKGGCLLSSFFALNDETCIHSLKPNKSALLSLEMLEYLNCGLFIHAHISIWKVWFECDTTGNCCSFSTALVGSCLITSLPRIVCRRRRPGCFLDRSCLRWPMCTVRDMHIETWSQ